FWLLPSDNRCSYYLYDSKGENIIIEMMEMTLKNFNTMIDHIQRGKYDHFPNLCRYPHLRHNSSTASRRENPSYRFRALSPWMISAKVASLMFPRLMIPSP